MQSKARGSEALQFYNRTAIVRTSREIPLKENGAAPYLASPGPERDQREWPKPNMISAQRHRGRVPSRASSKWTRKMKLCSVVKTVICVRAPTTSSTGPRNERYTSHPRWIWIVHNGKFILCWMRACNHTAPKQPGLFGCHISMIVMHNESMILY